MKRNNNTEMKAVTMRLRTPQEKRTVRTKECVSSGVSTNVKRAQVAERPVSALLSQTLARLIRLEPVPIALVSRAAYQCSLSIDA